MGKTWNVIIHHIIAGRLNNPSVIHQFCWPGLMYDIFVAREVAFFSCSNMRLKRRLGWEGKTVKKKLHILVFNARLGCSSLCMV